VQYGYHGEYAVSSQFYGHKIESLVKHEGWGSENKSQLVPVPSALVTTLHFADDNVPVPSALVTTLHFADDNGPTPSHQNFSITTSYSEVLKTKFVNGMFLV
jgi:hypothetical protein